MGCTDSDAGAAAARKGVEVNAARVDTVAPSVLKVARVEVPVVALVDSVTVDALAVSSSSVLSSVAVFVFFFVGTATVAVTTMGVGTTAVVVPVAGAGAVCWASWAARPPVRKTRAAMQAARKEA
jgi:hypothetical protein